MNTIHLYPEFRHIKIIDGIMRMIESHHPCDYDTSDTQTYHVNIADGFATVYTEYFSIKLFSYDNINATQVKRSASSLAERVVALLAHQSVEYSYRGIVVVVSCRIDEIGHLRLSFENAVDSVSEDIHRMPHGLATNADFIIHTGKIGIKKPTEEVNAMALNNAMAWALRVTYSE